MPEALTSKGALTPISVSCLVAVPVFVFGFGTLNALSTVGAGADDLPGLYTFRSATVGDALLLPFLAYGLARSAQIQGAWTRIELRLIATGALLGTIAGAAEISTWLLDSNPTLNWTLPAPGEFNLPGWYHAIFLVVASGFFTAAGAAVLLRLRSEVRDGTPLVHRLRSLGTLAVVTPGPAFVGLLLLDNGASFASSIISVSAASGVLSSITWWACGFPKARWALSLWLGSSGMAGGVCGLFITRMSVVPLFECAGVIAALGGIAATALFRTRSVSLQLALAASLGICGAGIARGVLKSASLSPMTIAVTCAAAAASTIGVGLSICVLAPEIRSPLSARLTCWVRRLDTRS